MGEDWGIYVYVTMSQDGCNVVVAQHSLSGGHVTTDIVTLGSQAPVAWPQHWPDSGGWALEMAIRL